MVMRRCMFAATRYASPCARPETTLALVVRALVLSLLALSIAAPSAARADTNRGAVALAGNVDARKQATAVAAVTSALRQAKWTVVDATFTSKEVQSIQACFTKAEPWSCLEPIAAPKEVSRLVLVELVPEKPGTIRINAQLATATAHASTFEYGYCTQGCSDTSLAQSAADLVTRLLASFSSGKGDTFIEVLSDPPGATVSIDGRLVGSAGQKFPVLEGRYRVLAQLSGHRDADTQIDVVQGETKRVKLTLDPIEVHVVGPAEHRNPPRKLQWGVIAAGGAMLAGGLIWSYSTALDDLPPPPLEHEYRYNGTALVVAGIGGAAAIGGLVWIWRTPKSTSKPTLSLAHDSVQAGWSIAF